MEHKLFFYSTQYQTIWKHHCEPTFSFILFFCFGYTRSHNNFAFCHTRRLRWTSKPGHLGKSYFTFNILYLAIIEKFNFWFVNCQLAHLSGCILVPGPHMKQPVPNKVRLETIHNRIFSVRETKNLYLNLHLGDKKY